MGAAQREDSPPDNCRLPTSRVTCDHITGHLIQCNKYFHHKFVGPVEGLPKPLLSILRSIKLTRHASLVCVISYLSANVSKYTRQGVTPPRITVLRGPPVPFSSDQADGDRATPEAPDSIVEATPPGNMLGSTAPTIIAICNRCVSAYTLA